METPDQRLDRQFRERLSSGDLPAQNHGLRAANIGISKHQLFHIFETQLMSRHLDYMARRLGREKRGFYSIGSAGHEGNACVAHALRVTDMAFLHYRSGGFLIERQRQLEGATPLWDMALSFVASSEDPVSGGRHKVLGSLQAQVPPQTSTIASHLPKAMGAAFSIPLAKRLGKRDSAMPHDAVVIASFGDASANHSTAVGAINAAANTAFRHHPLPLIFLCEDNGIGISVPTPTGWIKANYETRAGLKYVAGDSLEMLDALRAAKAAEHIARQQRRPVFLHLSTIRLMGHAGSDHELSYRSREAIEATEREDPLLKSARTLIEESVCSAEDILAFDAQIKARITRIAEQACTRPKLETAEAVMRAITPEPATRKRKLDLMAREAFLKKEKRALEAPQHMSRLISLALADILTSDKDTLLFGEDNAKKGGVYGATTKVQEKIGPARVFDTILDEQSILGLAIGMAQNGFLPFPEIQFLAYVHNAEDQIRGEAATLSFFSDGKLANPMVIRIAGLGYQRGFGGHFHNDNSIAVFRDIPGIILAVPSRGDDAVKMLRECYRLAAEERRVVIFLEPIALYGVKDLHEEGDGKMSFVYPPASEIIAQGKIGIDGDGGDVAIISYGNGAFLSRKAIKVLSDEHKIKARLIDLRWLSPLPIAEIVKAIGKTKSVLIVDECRKTGSVSEELWTCLQEAGISQPVKRITAKDSFIPLGAAAYFVLPSEADIIHAALALKKGDKK